MLVESLQNSEGRAVPIALPGHYSHWEYESFSICELSPRSQKCGRCDRSITYIYHLFHPTFGKAQIGMECVREVLSEVALKVAMHEFAVASCKLNQHRFKQRVTKLRANLPKGFLEVLTVRTKNGPVKVQDALNHLEDKLKLRVFLSKHEIEILQQIEAKL